MTEKEYIQIRIPKKKKREWKNAAEDEYGTLTYLISTAVEQELSNGYIPKDALDTMQADVEIDGVENKLDTIESKIDELNDEVGALADGPSLGKTELMDLGESIQSTLPAPGKGFSLEQIQSKLGDEYSKEEIREGLMFLRSNQHVQIGSHIDSGVKRWYDAT